VELSIDGDGLHGGWGSTWVGLRKYLQKKAASYGGEKKKSCGRRTGEKITRRSTRWQLLISLRRKKKIDTY